MESKQILDSAEEKMKKAVEFLKDSLTNIRAGKASTNILNGVTVEYYGSQMGIGQVASVTVPDAKTVLIQPWEKNMIGPIEKAIINANIGLTPSNNGEHIRLTMPVLTEERRKQLVKQVKEEAEKAQATARGLFSGAADHEHMPSTKLDAELVKDGAVGLLAAMVAAGLCGSNREARQLVQQGGVLVDGEKVTDPKAVLTVDALNKGVVIKKGKKVYHKVVL